MGRDNDCDGVVDEGDSLGPVGVPGEVLIDTYPF